MNIGINSGYMGNYAGNSSYGNTVPRTGMTDAADGKKECQTCKNRKYKDGSNDPGVSFKSAQGVSPEKAAGAVRSHEAEHVRRESAKAEREGAEVISQNVQIHTAVCPECGRTYVSGGTTTTTTAKAAESEYKKSAEYNKQDIRGGNVDMAA